jgi:SAM-dependent methyltransferase
MFHLRQRRPSGTGIGLQPGADHYRAYVGPPEDYDLIAAMVFNLLTCLGLRQQHRVLDIGCGSLRVGRLLIPYLNPGNYVGVEPNRWLVRDGIRNEVGRDQVRIKRPMFSYRPSLEDFRQHLALDYAVAQSIFSHAGKDLVRHWLGQLAPHLKESGALLATFIPAAEDSEGEGWVYPGCVGYRGETLAALAAEFGYRFELVDWWHPRQAWAIFARPGYDHSFLAGGAIGWNRAGAVRQGKPPA